MLSKILSPTGAALLSLMNLSGLLELERLLLPKWLKRLTLMSALGFLVPSLPKLLLLLESNMVVLLTPVTAKPSLSSPISMVSSSVVHLLSLSLLLLSKLLLLSTPNNEQTRLFSFTLSLYHISKEIEIYVFE